MDAPYSTRHGMCRWVFLLALALCLAALTIPVSTQARGAGASWLLEQQQQDGSIAAGADETTADHATFEAARALHAAHGSATRWIHARSFIEVAGQAGIPWLPRRLLTAVLAGESDAERLSDLLQRQNRDGGFGADVGDQSSLLDTLDALDALGALGFRDPAVLQPAIQFVLAAQAQQGGFAPNRASPISIYLTARAIQALQRHQLEFSLAAPLGAAGAYLWSVVADDTSFASWQKAQVLLALIPATTDPGRYESLLASLRSAQRPDGSWAGSVYSTALALRALQAAEAAGAGTGDQVGALGGRIVDISGEAPVAGASVSVAGASGNAMVLSGPDGRFLMADLLPGAYTLEVAAAGFQSRAFDIQLSPGLLLDLGMLGIALEAGTALVSGTVTDADAGQGLMATVTRLGSSGGSVTTATDGSFMLAVSAGELDLSVTAPGYQELRASAWVGSGDRLLFSPSLSRDGASDPNRPVEVTGRLLDADTLQPIPGAAVRVPDGSLVEVSDTAGEFLLAGIPPGETELELVHASYRAVLVKFLGTPGARIDLGDLILQATDGSGTTLQGQVLDASTGLPLRGAQVKAADQIVLTDEQGRYRIEQIPTSSFEARASAAGYRSATRRISLQQPGQVQLDFALERVETDGIRIAGLLAHSQTLGAFEEARFSLALENRGAQERWVILSATVEGTDTGLREDFVVPQSGGERSGAFMVPPDGSVLREFSWFTGAAQPGVYAVRAEAWSADGTTLLADSMVQITIAETVSVVSLAVMPEPRERVRGESAEVTVTSLIRNGSNVDTALGFRFVLQDPVGNSVYERVVRLELPPSAALLSYPLAVFDQHFERAGNYRIEVDALSGGPVGALHTGQIVVAPNVRLEGAHGVEPESIMPLEDARVRIRLRIEGKEDGQ